MLSEENNKKKNREVILVQLGKNQSTFTNNEKLIFEFMKSMNQEFKESKQKFMEKIDSLEKHKVTSV